VEIRSKLSVAAAALWIAVAWPSAGQAQQSAPRALPDGAADLIAEMTSIQSRLAPMQQRALESPSLRAEGEAIGANIRQVMAEIAPETPGLIARLNEMGAEVRTAQEARDSARVRTLVMEAREIEQLLQATQAAAVERPEITSAVEAFEAKVHTHMRNESPEAGPLLERLAALNEQLVGLLEMAP
jgi:hypothetical protein